jgi:hypothetical protein
MNGFFNQIPLMSGHLSTNVDSEGDKGEFGPTDLYYLGDDEGDGGGALAAHKEQGQLILQSILPSSSRIFPP